MEPKPSQWRVTLRFDGPCVPDKAKKYLTLIGGVLIHLSLGSFYTFGNMAPYIISYLRSNGSHVRNSDSIWYEVGFSLFQAISSITFGYLVRKNKWNMKLVMLAGCIINCAAIFLTFLTIQSSFLPTLLTYGIMNGAGVGVAYVFPLEFAMRWFPESKGLANSAILFGYGASATIFSQIQTQYINPKDYSPDLPYNTKHPDEKYFSQKDLLDRIPNVFIILGFVYFGMQMIGVAMIFEKKEKAQDQDCLINDGQIKSDDECIENSQVENLPSSSKNSLGVKYKDTNEGMTMKEVLHEPSYYLLVSMFIVGILGPSFSVSFYKLFGQEFISDDRFLSIIGSVSSIFNATGRFFWGFLIDRISFKRCYLLLNFIVIFLVATLYLQKTWDIPALYMAWICAIFFAQCGHFIITPTVASKLFGQRYFTTIYPSILLLALPSSFAKAGISELVNFIGWFKLFLIGAGFSLLGVLAMFFNVKNEKGRDI